MAETSEAKLPDQKWGEVVFAGGTDWEKIGKAAGGGKKQSDKEKADEARRKESYPDQLAPVRLKSLIGIKIVFVAAGSAACHSIIGDVEGRCYSWGRNNKGQLGHGDQLHRNIPTIVEKLKDMHIVGGSGGKHHTVVVTKDGRSLAFGSNLMGQCGTGALKSRDKVEELLLHPEEAKVTGCTQAACGAEFTMWVCSGKLYSAGNPQYGVLGHGTDHEYNAKDSSVKLMYSPQPTPKRIAAFGDRKVERVACGHQHTLAITGDGAGFTWGNGGYGRLGHKVQQDEFKPRQLEAFTGRNATCPEIAACTQAASFCMHARELGGQSYLWGKVKVSGDNIMYPKPLMDLSGWKVHHASAGATHFAVAADNSCITWGHAQNGELAYGKTGKKSSANPDTVKALEGAECYQTACGIGHTLFLMKPGSSVVEKLGVFEPEVAAEEAEAEEEEEEEEEEPAPKEKARAAPKGKGKAAAVKRKAAEPASKAKKTRSKK